MASVLSRPSPRPPTLRDAELNSFLMFEARVGSSGVAGCGCFRCDGSRPSVVERLIGGTIGGGPGPLPAGCTPGCGTVFGQHPFRVGSAGVECGHVTRVSRCVTRGPLNRWRSLLKVGVADAPLGGGDCLFGSDHGSHCFEIAKLG